MPGTVLTLDAGGTTFSFQTIRDGDEISEPLVLPAHGDNLKACVDGMIHGFEEIRKKAAEEALAISFAFPGPADYPNGIIGDLGNLPAFRGGVPLGPILAEHFKLPVFINNDGNLFALGEAKSGFLPRVNQALAKAGHRQRYRNLLAVTLGTGFGGGIVINGQLLIGDCSAAGEIWLLRHKLSRELNAEEGVSIRSVHRRFAELTGRRPEDVPEPRLIAEIADNPANGDCEAARESFRCLGEVLGDALANALTLIDGAVVIGGGLAGAARHFLPAVMAELNGRINGFPRLESRVFNLENPEDTSGFMLSGEEMMAGRYPYQAQKKIPLGISSLGTSRAVAVGAYHFAVNRPG
jgi:glucokinase